MLRSWRRTLTLVALAAVSLTGCGGGAEPAADEPNELRAMLPEEVREAGVLRRVTDPSSPPYNFMDQQSKQLQGLEVDLAEEIGRHLGVRIETDTMQFPGIIPAVQAGRYDFAMAAFGDFPEREKIVDVIDYSTEATSLVVPEHNPLNIQKISDLCGHTASVTTGSIPQKLLTLQNEKCAQPIDVLTFQTDDQAGMAVRTGRADAQVNTVGVAKYAIANMPATGGHRLKVLESSRYAVGYQGIIVSKQESEIRDAIVAALEAMQADGSYQRVFDKWGLPQNALQKIAVNDAAKYQDYLKLDD
ncbi:ABC transporter substrate-binding protein [Saccharopolyspora indica]|uniref:ABC transporter substrate-binding protein n=1 Tax=Saccharopolyspora indica TaxID=1229659 RepID=UPI0022EA1C8D|nr:ABC transporter substrate-binding protein [Saccharopolyspora indica]MDA3644444.1 ABC transporter substrate-binding protein [Saccharopolyspora indica]